jgi:hypothetical protein
MKGEKRNAYRILVGKPEETDYYENTDVGGRITLRWVLEGQDGVVRIGRTWPKIGISGGLL